MYVVKTRKGGLAPGRSLVSTGKKKMSASCEKIVNASLIATGKSAVYFILCRYSKAKVQRKVC